jgi:hypothetical protein
MSCVDTNLYRQNSLPLRGATRRYVVGTRTGWQKSRVASSEIQTVLFLMSRPGTR